MDASAIILGFTGRIGSGCSTIAQTIAQLSGDKYKYFKLSDIIRDDLKTRGVDNPTVSQMQDRGNELRREEGNGVLVKRLLQKIESEDPENRLFYVILDGFKNPGEIRPMRYFRNFYLFSVNAEDEVREKRCKDKGISNFEEISKRDQNEEPENGQKVKACNYYSDIVILNDEFIPSVHKERIENFVKERIFDKYVSLIEASVDGKRVLDRPPHPDELCMTIAYSLSKMSSCMKRQVGAVIAEFDQTGVEKSGHSNSVEIIPNIISTGYNEVPLGSDKCICHEDFQTCYRDHLQISHSKTINNCPACGTIIPQEFDCDFCKNKIQGYSKVCPHCQREDPLSYKCMNKECGVKVFEKFLPGGRDSAGKLLDLCRALHAEEMSLLKLAKTGARGNNLTLYTTTQPCNLCANKIVASGIKNVVFTEPYSMPEANKILDRGKVSVKKFEGVKSSAFFKFYR